MKIIYSPVHKTHNPRFEIANGEKVSHADKPERIEQIKKALVSIGAAEFIAPEKFSLREISKVHSVDYVNFLRATCKGLGREAVSYPAVFGSRTRENKVARLGSYAFDLYTPVMAGTFQAAQAAAFSALKGAKLLQQGEKAVYVLCRPPGHHAEKSRMGGYCYFNNAAIAAGLLRTGGARVAILDTDFHHGNGTQQIFYQNNEVLTLSIHADPNRAFPYFSGFSNEIGEGRGRGFNFNYPLPKGINGKTYLGVLRRAITNIKNYRPDFLIISLGFDTFKNDPLGDFQLDFFDYEEIGKRIQGLAYPTLFIQEGGYNISQIGSCAFHFFRAFLT